MKEGYKKVVLGLIPQCWDISRAKNLFSNNVNRSHKGGLEVLSVTQDRGVIPRSEVGIDIKYNLSSLINYKKVDKGDFVISLRSFQGGIEYSDYEGLVSPAYTILKEKKNLSKDYYRYFFKTEMFIKMLKSTIYGIRDGKQIRYKDFSELYLYLPPLPEQKKIAEILLSVDNHIDEVDGMINDLKELKKGLMQKLLTEGIGHTEFKDSPVGRIPVAWEVVAQGDISTFYNGRAYKRNEFKTEGTPIIRIQNLTGEGNFVYSDLNLEDNKYVENGDLMYAWSATFGPFIWNGERAIYHYHIWKVKCSNRIDKMFYYYRLNYISDELGNYKNGSAFVHITKGFMEKHRIALPTIVEQKKIAKILSSIDKRIGKYEEEQKDYQELKKGLMQQLLTGKIRVKLDN